ncbi:MAG: AraC family transcriptional regulator [Polyangiales bacterium]
MTAACVQLPSLEPSVWVGLARELVAAVERSGVPRAQFLAAVGLTEQELAVSDARLPSGRLMQMHEHALDLTGDPAFGLHWAEWLAENSFDLVSHLLTHTPTLRQAFDTLFHYGTLLANPLPFELVERGRQVVLHMLPVCEISARVQPVIAEMVMVGLLGLLRKFDPRAPIARASFVYPAPAHRAEYTRLFDGLECFDEPFTGLTFSRALLEAQSARRDDDLHGILRGLADQRLWTIQQDVSFGVRVRNILVQQGAPHQMAMRFVARELGLSVRSLHRRLSDEGQSYTAIAHEVYARVAKRHLAAGRNTIQEAAFAMGFAEASSFSRAFRRWTGESPTIYLAKQR